MAISYDLEERQVTAKPRTGRPRSDLRPYQREMIARLATGESLGLFWRPGAGKTAVVLHHIADALAYERARRALIVSTPNVVSTVWPVETAAWQDTNDLEIAVATGTQNQRDAVLASDARVVAVSFDVLHTAIDHAGRFDILVIDEASLARNIKSRRFRALIQFAAKAKQRIVLTGSPAPNSCLDVFGVVALIDLGERLGTNHSKFLALFGEQYGKRSWQIRPNAGAASEITAIIKPITSSLRTEDVATLPPLRKRLVEVDIGDEARRVYEGVETALLDHLTGDRIHQDAALIKLQQIANGHLKDADGVSHRIHRAKIDAAAEIIGEALDAGEQVQVIYGFREDLALLREAFPQTEVLGSDQATGRSEDLVRRWNASEIDLLAFSPRAAGHGVNLQGNRRCFRQIWISPTWSAELYEQTTARLHRPGQVNPVEITLILAADTVDAVIGAVMGRKLRSQDLLMAALKERKEQADPGRAEALREARKRAAALHPDAGGDAEAFRIAWSAYQALLDS